MANTSQAAAVNLFGATSAPIQSQDFSKSLKKMYEQALEISKGVVSMALDAVRAMWRWFTALLARIARALGLRAAATAELSDSQAAGQAETPVSVEQLTDANGQPIPPKNGLPAEVGAAAIFAEAARMMDHLVNDGTIPAELADPGRAMDMVKFYLDRLGRYRAAFLDHEATLEAKIAPRLAEVALAQNTTPEWIRHMLEGEAEAGLIDGQGDLKSLLKEVHDTRLSWARVETVAKSLVDASNAPGAKAGLYDFAEIQFKSLFPGAVYDRQEQPTVDREDVTEATGSLDTDEAKPLDRKDPGVAGDATRPPEGVVAQSSGDSAGLVGDDLDARSADAPMRNNSASTSLDAPKLAFTDSVSRNTLAANLNTPSNAARLQLVSQVGAGSADLGIAESGTKSVSLQVPDVEKRVALKSAFSQFVGRRPSFDEDFDSEGSGALEDRSSDKVHRPGS